MISKNTIAAGLFGIFAVLIIVAALMAPVGVVESGPPWDVIATGLNNPRGLAIGSDGGIYIAEAGDGGEGPCFPGPEGEVCVGQSSGVSRVLNGVQERLVSDMVSFALSGEGVEGHNAIGLHDLSFDESGNLFGVVGLGMDPAQRDPITGTLGTLGPNFGQLVSIDIVSGTWENEVDISAYESTHNPDGGHHDSNPFSLISSVLGHLVADAGGNDYLGIDPAGTITTTGVLSDTLVEFPPGSGNMIPMQAVPTGIILGPGPSVYGGQLTGFPFPVGAANVYSGAEINNIEVYASGFTNVLDVAFDSDGNLFVLEMFTNGLLSGDPTGALIRVEPDGTRTNITPAGLVAPTGMAIDSDGFIYVSNNGIFPANDTPNGQVVRISGVPTAVSLSGFSGESDINLAVVALIPAALLLVAGGLYLKRRQASEPVA
jgi:hypothetical protein